MLQRQQCPFSGHTATRRVARPRKSSGKRLPPRLFNRICVDRRAPENRRGCRRGDSAGERVPYDVAQPYQLHVSWFGERVRGVSPPLARATHRIKRWLPARLRNRRRRQRERPYQINLQLSVGAALRRISIVTDLQVVPRVRPCFLPGPSPTQTSHTPSHPPSAARCIPHRATPAAIRPDRQRDS